MKYNKYSLILNIMDIIGAILVSIFIILVCCGLTSKYLKYKSLMNDAENNVHFEYKEFDYCFNFKEFILLADTKSKCMYFISNKEYIDINTRNESPADLPGIEYIGDFKAIESKTGSISVSNVYASKKTKSMASRVIKNNNKDYE